MLNMETLDKVIALVVVLLALSLFIQSLQGLLKKLFKIKSLQIEQSLVHLYSYVLEKNVVQQAAVGRLEVIKNWATNLVVNSPVVRTIIPRAKHPSERDPEVDALFKGVAAEFKKVGRVTQTGRLMMDSISRDDLLKFMNRMPVAALITQMFANMPEGKLHDLGERVAAYQKLIAELKSRYQAVVQQPSFVKLEQTLSPILGDLGNFLSGASMDSGKLLADIANLRQLDRQQVSQLMTELPHQLAEIENFIEQDTSSSEDEKKIARGILENMKKSSTGVSEALDDIVRAFNTVQGLKARVETWYDTVMQSFEERYTRGMKTWTVVISAVVVIVFNINVLNVYREISTSSAKRALILQSADKVLAKSKASTTPNTTTPNTTTDPNVTPEQAIEEAKKIFSQENINYMTDIGLKGPKWITEIPAFVKNEGYTAQKTQADSNYRPKAILKTIFGWMLMTLLLTAGAPFWEDTLETLFGLKNRMRKQTETRNTETASGAGQTKS